MAVQAYDKPVTTLLTDLLGQVARLVRAEGQLARTEVSEKINQMALGLGLIIGGAVLLMPALVVLLQAAVAALQDAGLQPHWSALIVGGAALLIGLVLLLFGFSRLKARNLLPDRTLHQLQEDASVAKHQIRSDHEYQRAA